MSDLVLGWKVNSEMVPSYWLSQDAKPGSQSPHHLITAAPTDMAHHTVIVAQSGSGKSFFLGRLLEELALNTRGRLLVLDPNADFRRIADVVPESWWTSAGFDLKRSRGRLPHEPSRQIFEDKWKAVNPQVLSGPYSSPQNSTRLRVSWSTFPIAFLAEDLDAIARSQVYHCHEFVKSVASLEAEVAKRSKGTPATKIRQQPIDKARKLLQRARYEGARQILEEEFPLGGGSAMFQGGWLNISRARERAISAVEFISPEIERFYFGRAKEYVAEGIVADGFAEEAGKPDAKARIVDLPSFRDSRTQQVVLSSVVEAVWEQARQQWAVAFTEDASKDERVPLFIVVEEAHNIVPQEAQTFSAKALREQFRTIAAEGRKYGVFLILCTQRPDKIDPTIISECENRAVMRIGSRVVMERTKDLLGLDAIAEKLAKCLDFQKGCFLLFGPWSGEGAQLGYSAMRRTFEGGRDLREDYWAVPEPIPSNDTAPPGSTEIS